jgi:hypothetical protein
MARANRTTSVGVLGHVYFIQEAHDGLIKIGRCFGHPLYRLQNLQVGAPQILTLLADMPGGEHEREIQAKFRHLHVRGEWHRPEPDLLAFIAAIKADQWHFHRLKLDEFTAADR